MMKLFLFVSFLFSSNLGRAKPGDWTLFAGKKTNSCSEQTQSYNLRATQLTNPSQDWVRVRFEKITPGKVDVSEEDRAWIDGSALSNPANLIEYCENVGGKIEKIKVTAGEFESCRQSWLDQSGWRNIAWVGPVPMGLILGRAEKTTNPGGCRWVESQELRDFGPLSGIASSLNEGDSTSNP